jgi:streptogramin lyase
VEIETTTSRLAASPGITRIVRTSLVDDLAVSGGAVWIATGGLVLRVDPLTRRVRPVPGIEAEPPVVRLTAGAGAVWAATTGGRLLRIDPRSARIIASLSVPAEALTADARGVWVACCGAGVAHGQLIRVDPASNRVVATIRLPGVLQAVGVGPSGVWARGAGLLWRVNPASNRVIATVRLPPTSPNPDEPGGGGVAVTKSGVWVSDPAAATVWHIDPRRNQLTDDRLEADGHDLAVAADGVVWATSDTRLLGLGGPEVRGPRRNLHELETSAISCVAAAPDGGLWLGTPDGVFHVERRVLLER